MTKGIFVLDAFAFLAHFRDEPGAPAVRSLLYDAANQKVRLVASVINVAEAVYKTLRERGEERAWIVYGNIRAMAVEILPVDEVLAIAAAIIKGTTPISYADCIAAALAQRLDATLVTGDRDFGKIPDLNIEWLDT